MDSYILKNRIKRGAKSISLLQDWDLSYQCDLVHPTHTEKGANIWNPAAWQMYSVGLFLRASGWTGDL